ncbi:PKD domain-containing protein [Labilibaculum sp.]|uniref:PKD domain-containing protein n=1 Tax=Labilibaculum sp. TaxID=2060723 RepID=UPI003569C604
MANFYLVKSKSIIKKILIALVLFIPYQVFAGDPPTCDFGDEDGYFYHWDFSATNLEFDFTLENFTDDTISNDISEYTIDWGDDSSTETVTTDQFPLDHTYDSEGQFTLLITIIYSDESYSYEYIVYNTVPSITLTKLEGNEGCIGQEYTFQISDYEDNPSTTSYEWYFDDTKEYIDWTQEEAKDNDGKISHTYNIGSCSEEGDRTHFSVTMTPYIEIGSNELSENGTAITKIKVSQPTSIDLSLKVGNEKESIDSTHTGCINNTEFEFTNTSDYGLQGSKCEETDDHGWIVTKYEDGIEIGDADLGIDYEFSSGSADETGDISIVFLKTGTYTISFYLENTCSTTEDTTIETTGLITIYENTNTTTYTPTAYCLADDETVSFTTIEDPELEAIQETTYLWSSSAESYEFVEGTSSTSQNPKIKFSEAGQHTVYLEKTSLCGTEQYEYIVKVSDVPIVEINSLSDLSNGGYCGTYTFSPTADFTDNGEETFGIEGNVIDEYLWTFINNGITTTSSSQVPGEITFDQTGASSISLEAHNSCGWSLVDKLVFEIYEIPTAEITSVDETCEDVEIDYTALPDGMKTYSWLFGDGNTESVQNPTHIFTNAGSYTNKLTVTSSDGCSNSFEKEITIIAKPVIETGDEMTICSNTASFEITDVSAEHYSAVNWTSNTDVDGDGTADGTGTGSFTENGILTPTYYLSDDDKTKSTITLILTATGNGDCSSVSASKTINITPAPSISISSASATTCENTDFIISEVTVENEKSIVWSSSVNGGSFSSTTVENPTYTPPVDYSGSITLTVTAIANTSCDNISDVIELAVKELPTVDAGEDITICENETISLSGESTGTTYKWTILEEGNGTFGNDESLSTTYTPGSDDIDNGSVVLQLTAKGDAVCSTVSDTKTITIQKNATANAGADADMCTTNASYTIQTGSDADMAQASYYESLLWTTDNGTGDLTNATSLNATYTPSEADLTNGSVVLKLTATPETDSPCSDVATDEMTLTFTTPPDVEAGDNITSCQGKEITISGTSENPADILEILWSTSGKGTFSPNNDLSTSYQPLNSETGNYTLTLTATSTGSCESVSDALEITLIAKVTADAGADGEVCSNGTYNLSAEDTGASVTTASSVKWTKDADADGTFNDDTKINAIYTPGANDIANGSVTLTLTAQPESPCDKEATDDVTISITPAPTVEAGEDQNICQGNKLELTGANATNYSSLEWKSSSTSGYFINADTFNATYYPGANDTGKYTLTLVAYGEGACSYIEDQIQLNITSAPVVEIDDDSNICEDSEITLNASVSNDDGYTWTTTGTGNLSDTDGLTPTYQTAEGETGDITISLTARGNTYCNDITESTTLSIIPHPAIDAGDDAEVCSNTTYEMNVGDEEGQINAESWSSIEYSTSGDGFFSDQDGLNVTYVPGDTDKSNKEVDITIRAYAINPPCDSYAEDVMTLEITPAPIVNAGDDDKICQNDTYELANASTENTNSQTWTSLAGGSFDDENLLHAIYTPTTDKTGTIQLQLTGKGDGSCDSNSDIMSLQIVAIPKVSAGDDANICFNKTYELTGSVASSFSEISWTTDGTGSFSDTTALHPTYFPSDADYESTSVQLTVTVQGLTPCSMNATDALKLSFVEAPSISAGNDDEICQEDGSYIIQAKSDENPTGTSIENVSSYIWETDGEGSLQNSNTLTPKYIPADNETGIIHITLTAEGYSNCETIEDEMELNIIPTPSADFSTGTTCIDNLVDFEDMSDNGDYSINSWSWDFGDGDTSTDQNPSHEFANVDDYSVSLTVTNEKGCTATTSKTVSIHALPTIAFTHEEYAGVNVATEFTNESSNAVSYNWDFGDSSSSTEKNPNHSYTNSGVYTVTLEGESSYGCVSQNSSTIEVIGLPKASFTKTADGCGPLTVEFTNTSTGKFLSYYWDFGNGITSTEENVDPIVFAPGTLSDTTYTVNLTIENKAGKSTYSDIVTVKPLPVPEFEILPTSYGCSPVVRSIYNQTTGLPNSYSFDFGDGTTYEYETPDIERPFEHTFVSNDIKTIFTITLTATNECGDQSTRHDITVFPNTAVAVMKADETSGCAPLTVAFENLSTGAGDYLESDWIFEDDIVDIRDTTGETVYHTFEEAGVFEVELTVHDTCATDYTTTQITVISAPEIDFNISYTKLCESESVSFSVSDEIQSEFTNFTWDLGDGTSYTGTQIDHEYASAETYTIQLSATSIENGCEKTASKEISIDKSPLAKFELSTNEGCEPLVVSFTNESTDANYYQWDFDDGAQSSTENPEHTFASDDYEISLIVESEAGCSDSISAEISVHPLPEPAFELGNNIECSTPATIEVSNITENKELNSYTWNFGNGTISDQTDPDNEIFTDYGDYTISLKAENKFLCSDSCSQEISIYETPTPAYEILSTTSCEGDVIEFEDISENSITSYWEFSDGFSTEGSTASHMFSDYGQYDLFLKSVGEGNCADSIYIENAIQVYPIPYADFSWENINTVPEGIEIEEGSTAPNNGTIQFTDLSSEIDEDWITEQWYTYKWDFDDFSTSSEKSPIHQYTNNGDFYVTLYTESAYSCKDSIEKKVEVDLMSGLFVPNAFNPGNPDEEVALFLPKGIGLFTYHVKIMDNWGNSIWESEKIEDGRPAEGWDGTKNGEAMPQGVYIWKIRAVFTNGATWQGMEINGKNYREGSVTLIQ